MLDSMDLRIVSRNFESALSVVIVPQDFQDIVYSVHSTTLCIDKPSSGGLLQFMNGTRERFCRNLNEKTIIGHQVEIRTSDLMVK